MEIYRVVNEGKKVFKSKWDNNTYTIRPGSEVTVPVGAVVRWTGNTNTINTTKNKARYDEFTRLRTLYGAYHDDEAWEKNKPRLAVYTLEGDRITTVIDDPDGTSITGVPRSRTERGMSEQVDDLERQLEAMKRSIADMEAARATGRGAIEGRPFTDTADTDEQLGPDDEDDEDEDDEPSGKGPDKDSNSFSTEPGPPDPITVAAESSIPATANPQVTEDVPGKVRVGTPRQPKK